MAFHLLETLANPCQSAAKEARKRTKASSVVMAVVAVNQLLRCLLLLTLIVFHGFNDSIDEARVKVRSAPVTLNQASRTTARSPPQLLLML